MKRSSKFEKKRNKILDKQTEKKCHLYEVIKKGTIV